MTVVKYKNRKMYDPQASKYVNLDEIGALAKIDGFKVVERETGTDITAKVLAAYVATNVLTKLSTTALKAML